MLGCLSIAPKLNPHKNERRAANEIGASIIGGHAGYSASLSRPLVAVTALGTASGRQPVQTNGAQVGDYLLVTKGIALEGTSILAHDFTDVALDRGLDSNDIATARRLINEVSIVPEALAIADAGATAMHDVTRGGVLEALLEIAHLSQVAIEIEVDKLPSRPIVSQFAAAFQFDPLRMISSGTLVATIPPEQVKVTCQALTVLDVPFAFAGQVKEGIGLIICQDEGRHHYTKIRCEEDELARMWALFPR